MKESIQQFQIIVACLAIGCATAWGEELQLQGRVVTVDKITTVRDQASNGVYHVQRAVKPPALDGKPDEWKDVPAMVLDRKEQSRGPWTGSADLSGALRMLWDDEGLYFCLQVTDDEHAAPNADKLWWENDCCQFAFDPQMNGPTGGYDPDEHSYVVCDTPKGTILGAYREPGPAFEKETLIKGIPVAMSVVAGGARVFEWAMPWKQLVPISPWILGRCGFSFTLNDNDGNGFKGAICWTRGIISSQDASKFGQIVFDGAVGTRPAALGLRPEFKSPGSKASYWLQIAGADPWEHARLLILAPQETQAEATVDIYREGEKKPVATGTLKRQVQANRPTVFTWETGSLPNGKYELVYRSPQIPDLPEYRMGFFHLNIDRLIVESESLRARFGVDRPWHDMAEAPALIRRHRGMVALALEMLAEEEGKSTGNWTEAIRNVDQREEHLKGLANSAAMVEALCQGEDFLSRQRGVFWSAYYSLADGSGQPFVVTLPPDFKPSRAYPLIVSLHGGRSVPAPKGTGIHHGVPHIRVMPWGRSGSSGYRGLGEIDVLDVIRHMKEWYRIDEDRVYVTGASMGGMGTWQMASRHPDVFAGAAPQCGWGSGPPIENLRHVPVFNQHGGQDWSVSIDESRYLASLMQRMGYTLLYKEIPEASHSISQTYPAEDWLLSIRRPARPAQVTFSTDRPYPPFHRAYWLTVRELADPRLPARIDATVDVRGKPQSLTVGIRNAQVLELDVASMPLDRGRELLAQVGFDFIERKAPLPERMWVVKAGDHWTLVDRWAPPESPIRPYRAGAAANLYVGEPLTVVYGSEGSQERVQVLRSSAAKIARCAGAPWDRMPGAGFQVKADRDITDDEMAQFNLVLVGGFKENRITARLLPQLPLKINEKSELIAGEREPVSLNGAGVRLLSCNPLATRRLVFIIACDEDTKEARAWYEQGAALLTGSDGDDHGNAPDLVVQTLAPPDGTEGGGPDRRRMQFAEEWKWRRVDGADRRIPESAAASRRIVVASLAIVHRASGSDFAVGPCPKKGEKWCDARWFTQADAAVEVLPHRVLIGAVSGEELAAIHERWIAKEEMTIVPPLDPKALDPKRIYRLAMDPGFCGELSNRQKNLRDVEAGPEWRQEELWAELFGEEQESKARQASKGTMR